MMLFVLPLIGAAVSLLQPSAATPPVAVGGAGRVADQCNLTALERQDSHLERRREELVDVPGHLSGTLPPEASPERSTACPANAMFGQLPSGTNSWGAYTSAIRTGSAYKCYENFAGVTDQIGSVRWWGFMLFYDPAVGWLSCNPQSKRFAIEFSQYPGGPSVKSYVVTPAVTDTGVDYWVGPGRTYRLYCFDASLPSCCVLGQGWLSIQSLWNPDECAFLWMNSPQGDELAFQDQNGDLVRLNKDLSACLSPADCPAVYGACCLYWIPVCYDDTSGSDCLAMGGYFGGGASACADLDPTCQDITGACCHPDGTCELTTNPACFDTWLGPNSQCFTCPCVVPCPGGAIPEGEPDCYDGYVDTYNRGCPGENFLPIIPGETYCGKFGTYMQNPDGSGPMWRDYDSYELVLTEPANVFFTAEAECMVHYGIKGQLRWGCPGCDNVIGHWYWAVNEKCTPETLFLPCLAPGTYYFFVTVSNFSRPVPCGTPYTATWITTPCSLPPGEVCETAFVIGTLPFTGTGNTCDFADNYDAVCPYASFTRDVVYAYTAQRTQDIMVDLCESAFDTKLYVYEDYCPPCNSAPPIACSDDHPECDYTMSRIDRLTVQAGHTYYIVIDGYNVACGDYVLQVTSLGLPGDLNCDGVVDFGDINPFVMFLSNYTAWQAAFPGCPATNGDINGDGVYPDFADINPFVALLTSR